MLTPETAALESFKMTTVLKKEPKVFVAAQRRKIEVVEENETEILLKGSVTFETVEAEQIMPSFPTNFKEAVISKESQMVSIEMEGAISAFGALEAELIHTPLIGQDRKLATLKAEYPSEKVKINGNKIEINLKGLIEGELEKRMVINLKLGAKLNINGEILNSKKPEGEKSYNKIKIKAE